MTATTSTTSTELSTASAVALHHALVALEDCSWRRRALTAALVAARTTIATTALLFAPMVARATTPAPATHTAHTSAAPRCATAKRTYVAPDGTIRIQSRTVCVAPATTGGAS